MTYKILGLVILSLLTIGCATSNQPIKIVGEDPAVVKLQKTAADIHQSVQQLAELQQAATPRPKTYSVPQSGPLSTQVTIAWNGPPEPVLDMLADMIGYDFRKVGKRPHTTLIVGVEARNVPAWNILEDIGWQLWASGTVVVDETTREIQLIYKGVTP